MVGTNLKIIPCLDLTNPWNAYVEWYPDWPSGSSRPWHWCPNSGHRSCSRKKDTNGTESLVFLDVCCWSDSSAVQDLQGWVTICGMPPTVLSVWGQCLTVFCLQNGFHRLMKIAHQCQFGVTTLSFVLMGDKKVDRCFPCWPFGKWKTPGVDLSAPWTNLKQIQAVYTSENYHASAENHPEMKRNIIWTKLPRLLGSKCQSSRGSRVSFPFLSSVVGNSPTWICEVISLTSGVPIVAGLTAAQIQWHRQAQKTQTLDPN